MKKEDIVLLRIEDLSSDGLGIGHTSEGMAVFVKDTVIGDQVRAKIIKVKKHYAFGRLEEIVEASPERCKPRCPSARACGGCQIQMMDYEAQLKYKQKKVKDCLERIGGISDVTVLPTIGMESPWRYRNKAQFPVGTGKNGKPIAGFYAARTHSIIEQRDCMLGVPENARILERVLQWMEQHHISAYDEKTGKGLIRHVMIRKGFATGQIMVCIVANTSNGKLPHSESLIQTLTEAELGDPVNAVITSIVLNCNTENTNVILGKRTLTLWGKDVIEDRIGDVRYEISARSFYQVNPEQTAKLYQTALDYADLRGQETVWDLYCGIGTISLFLAQKAGRVYGVEIVPEAIQDAKRNAELNGMTNAEFFVGKAEEVLPEKYRSEKICADVIVIDPPRAGCERPVLDTMIAMAPDRIVYVSCDPATLARDLGILRDGGYEIQKVQPVDQFGHSTHVETCVLLTKASASED